MEISHFQTLENVATTANKVRHPLEEKCQVQPPNQPLCACTELNFANRALALCQCIDRFYWILCALGFLLKNKRISRCIFYQIYSLHIWTCANKYLEHEDWGRKVKVISECSMRAFILGSGYKLLMIKRNYVFKKLHCFP